MQANALTHLPFVVCVCVCVCEWVCVCKRVCLHFSIIWPFQLQFENDLSLIDGKLPLLLLFMIQTTHYTKEHWTVEGALAAALLEINNEFLVTLEIICRFDPRLFSNFPCIFGICLLHIWAITRANIQWKVVTSVGVCCEWMVQKAKHHFSELKELVAKLIWQTKKLYTQYPNTGHPNTENRICLCPVLK